MRKGRIRTSDPSRDWLLLALAAVLIAVACFGRRYLLPRFPRPPYAPSARELWAMGGSGCYIPADSEIDP